MTSSNYDISQTKVLRQRPSKSENLSHQQIWKHYEQKTFKQYCQYQISNYQVIWSLILDGVPLLACKKYQKIIRWNSALQSWNSAKISLLLQWTHSKGDPVAFTSGSRMKNGATLGRGSTVFACLDPFSSESLTKIDDKTGSDWNILKP